MVPLLEDVEEGSGSGSDVSPTMVGGPEAGEGQLAVTATSKASPDVAGPAITFYRTSGEPVVLDRETLQFWLLLFQTVALLALVAAEVRS